MLLVLNTTWFICVSGDIGGSLGLFIGASMLTILEIIDLALIQLPIFKHKPKRKQNEQEKMPYCDTRAWRQWWTYCGFEHHESNLAMVVLLLSDSMRIPIYIFRRYIFVSEHLLTLKQK